MSIGSDKRISSEEKERVQKVSRQNPANKRLEYTSMTSKHFSSKLSNRPKVVTIEVPTLIGTDKDRREVNRLKSEGYMKKA